MSSLRIVTVSAGLGVALVGLTGSPAGATVHEITAAYCSGGGGGAFDGNAVDPPGLGVFGSKQFAKPVIASGAIDATLHTTGAPQVKVQPGLFAPTLVLDATTIDHPSEHCAALRSP